MILGIVGSEAKKFTAETERKCREAIREILKEKKVTKVVSGECHLGGVDIYAKEEALKAGLKYQGFPPKTLSWTYGYKLRNEQIAQNSDEVACFTIAELPPGYDVKGFELYCYHCDTKDHIKSGGCWTTKCARRMGKPGYTLVIR